MIQSFVCSRSHATNGTAGFVFLAATLLMPDHVTVVGRLDSYFRRGGISLVIHGGGSLSSRSCAARKRRDAVWRPEGHRRSDQAGAHQDRCNLSVD
jgi:hypothetical protein